MHSDWIADHRENGRRAVFDDEATRLMGEVFDSACRERAVPAVVVIGGVGYYLVRAVH
jgi:hypothetical protein